MPRNPLTVFILLCFTAALSVDASAVAETPRDRQRIEDQTGRIVSIPIDPQRVISAHGPTTSFLYVAGVADRLVAAGYLGARDPRGRAAMQAIDNRFPGIMRDGVFSQRSFNVEEAIRLEADLVVTSARSSWVDVVERAGIPVVLFKAESTEGLIDAMNLVGAIFGTDASTRIATWIDEYQALLGELNGQNESSRRVLFTGPDPLQVAGQAMYQNDMILFAGGTNVAEALRGFWTEVGPEQVALWNPDIVLVPAYGRFTPAELAQAPGWSTLPAVTRGAVYQMPKLVAPWDTPTPDSLLGIYWLAELLAEESDGARCRQIVADYYRRYYQYEVEDLDYFCSALD